MFDPEALHAAVLDATRQAVQDILSQHPDEKFYGFCLFTTTEATDLWLTANTHEALAKSAKGEPGRWEFWEWTYKEHLASKPLVSAALEQLYELIDAAPEEDDEAYDKLYTDGVAGAFDAYVQTMTDLDVEGAFAIAGTREGIVLALTTNDNSLKQQREWLGLLNTDVVADRVVKEIKRNWSV